MQGSERGGLHQEGTATRDNRKEKEIGEVLNLKSRINRRSIPLSTTDVGPTLIWRSGVSAETELDGCRLAFDCAQEERKVAMKNNRRVQAILAMVLVLVGAQYSAAQGKKPNIVILATGGTIAGAAASGTQSGY